MVPADGPTASPLRRAPGIRLEHRDVGPAPGWRSALSWLMMVNDG